MGKLKNPEALELIQQIKDIGESLGYETKEEYPVNGTQEAIDNV